MCENVQGDCDIIRPICVHLLGTGRGTAYTYRV